MKKNSILLIIITLFFLDVKSQNTHTISINGLSFSPDEITIAVGDTIFFNGSSDHPVLEVDDGTWNANEDEALSGGFAFPEGVGKISFDTEGIHYFICENHVSSGMKGKINVSTTTSSAPIDQSELNIKIFPNPIRGNKITIKTENTVHDVDLNVYDLTGKLVISRRISMNENEYYLDGSSLPSGAYIFQLKSGDHLSTRKLIKY